MVLACLIGVFDSIGGSCLGWIGQRVQTEATLLTSYPDNMEDLKKQVKNLSDTIKSLKNRIEDAANNQGATLVDPVVTTLLEGMSSLKEEASNIIIEDERSSDSTCLMGFRPNMWACYQTSKLAKLSIDEAAELLEKEKEFDRPVASVDYSNFSGVTPISEFEEFESRRLVSDQIVAALKDSSVNVVGVYGMGGAGKTTLAEKIGAFLQRDSTFNYVVLATVSEKQSQHDNNFQPDLFNIQKQIAEGFKIKLQNETLKNRAAELDGQLQKRDKVLIILDDIWSGFELKDVGIPIGNVGKKIKILMTSRSEAVLLKAMNSERNFGLDSLPIDDAWILFDKMVGGHSHYSNWRATAEQVVKQCGGVPIILVTIAKALRNEASESWEDVLTQLKQFEGQNILEAHKMIEVSYKFLNSEEKKKLLLLCAQLNHRAISKEDLLKYAMGLNLFNGCKTLKEVRNRLHRYLSDLKGCCLLQDGNKKGMIKMHDVVHKFASSVALRDHHVFSVADGELQDWPSKDELEHFSAISLPECHLPPHQMLPPVFDNPKLESFLMFRSEIDESFQIPDNFFVGMKGLKLMHLTEMSLSPVLVSSLGALVKLRTLWLNRCELSDIAVIGELPMLQALSLVGSSILLVPKEIGNLGSTLKLLDLSNCRKLKMIASGVIFRLTLLEHLRIGNSCNQWERLEGSHKRSNIVDETNREELASMEEFKNLQNLIDLEIHIYDHAEMFPKDLVFKMLETFKITFGNGQSGSRYIVTRMLTIDECDTVVDFDSVGTKSLMTTAESLWIARVKSCVSVSEMDPKGFPELKHLSIHHGDAIQYIVTKNYRNCIFQKLENLNIYYIQKLERICDDHHHPLLVGSFENLRIIYVIGCTNLKDLFSSYLAKRLLSLEEITLERCRSMKSIIVSREIENGDEIAIGFTHQLRVLKLYDLPDLMSFYSLKGIEGHPPPTHLFNKKIMFPELQVLELRCIKIETIWDDHLAITTEGTWWLQNLTSVTLHSCHNLKYVFTSSMVNSLAQLKQLEVEDCESMEEIVASTEGAMAGDVQLLFPKLDSLMLQEIPELKRFCHANLLECPSLQTLFIMECPLLNTFMGGNESCLFDKKIVFPKLEELKLSNNMEIEKIWDLDHLAITSEGTCWFQNLTRVELLRCDNLRYVFTSSMVKRLEQLKKLKLLSCESIEEIVASTAGDIQLSFPKLDNIELKHLPKLKRFCQADFLECQVLRGLLIKDCSELKTFVCANDSDNSTTLFTEKIAFPNMSKLKIKGCDYLEKVFDVRRLPMNERETCKFLPFQNLRSVVVSKCQSLTSIPTSLILTCQQLELLKVRHCDKIDLLSFNNIQLLNDAFAKVTSNLKDFNLESGGLKLKYQHQRFQLEIIGSDFEVPPLFFAILQSFPKLDRVVVSNYSVIHLFPCETYDLGVVDDRDTQAKTLVRLPLLKLTNLSKMEHIWSEHSSLKYHVIPEVLEVGICDSLLSLAPPSTTLFKNLTGLVVWRCPMLIKLVESSALPKSLVNLKEMSVGYCDSLEEIVVIGDELEELTSSSTQECIVFEKLEVLKLGYLGSLASFCSTSHCNFRFPSLNQMILVECPKMKFFSNGDLSTPNLTTVDVGVGEDDDSEIRERWEGDLNATIRQMFEELEEEDKQKGEDEDKEEKENRRRRRIRSQNEGNKGSQKYRVAMSQKYSEMRPRFYHSQAKKLEQWRIMEQKRLQDEPVYDSRWTK